jgi:hypothetical protein
MNKWRGRRRCLVRGRCEGNKDGAPKNMTDAISARAKTGIRNSRWPNDGVVREDRESLHAINYRYRKSVTFNVI